MKAVVFQKKVFWHHAGDPEEMFEADCGCRLDTVRCGSMYECNECYSGGCCGYFSHYGKWVPVTGECPVCGGLTAEAGEENWEGPCHRGHYDACRC